MRTTIMVVAILILGRWAVTTPDMAVWCFCALVVMGCGMVANYLNPSEGSRL